jgi:sigma-B regulation protein RsbU (phosphoserine phosphatase)
MGSQRGFVVVGDGASRRRVAVGDGIAIGRSSQCQLVLADGAASRRHLEVKPENGHFVCRDLGSRNGVKVNGRTTLECTLEPGDRLLVGETVLEFEVAESPEESFSDRTMFMPTVLDAQGREADSAADSRPRQLLETAYTLMNAIATNFDPCDLAETILGITSQAIRGRRAAILYAGDDGELLPCSACGAVHSFRSGVHETISVGDIEISETIARRVLTGGESVLFRSARTDATVDLSLSIRALNLTSVLCVPIRAQDRTLGILYIDTDVTSREYSEDELLLASAAGNSAGLALDNARIHQELLQRNRVDQEISDAWAIQEGFLVHDWPENDPRLAVYGETRPAKTVGGDFYDFIRLDDDTVGVLIGDVSGKGVPAALTMAQLVAEFRVHARAVRSPSEVLRRINTAMVQRTRRGTFCSMSYIVADLNSGHCVAGNAGHHPAAVVSAMGVSSAFPPSGPPVGILAEADWTDDVTTIPSGHAVVLSTDGITEARTDEVPVSSTATPNQYGAERLNTRLLAAAADSTAPDALIRAVMEDVQAFCGSAPPFDDRTMIALRIDHA